MKRVWKDEYNLGIKEIDQQHQYFYFLMNEVDQSVQDKDSGRLGGLLDEIFKHTAKHFSTEDEYFDRYHYKNSKEHKAEHRKLIVDALNFKNRYENEGLEIMPEFMDFLNDWMVKHISTSDFDYGRYIKNVGMQEYEKSGPSK